VSRDARATHARARTGHAKKPNAGAHTSADSEQEAAPREPDPAPVFRSQS